ncbi:hypothetical protein GOB57_21845 [Sinorhizobium meliloti]|nr:hypothetical protein [Sinorhizobium meliloti]
MIITMPFLQRMRTATAKTPEPREIAAWDSEPLRLAEFSVSDFEQGSELGSDRTITAEGKHWAKLTEVFPNIPDAGTERVSSALECLAISIDCSRFFANGREKLPQTSILKKPPSQSLIRHSEREVNVAKLDDWVRENLVCVEGEPYVRVREPTVCLDFVGPFEGERCYLTLKRGKLVPAPYEEYEHAVMATISGRYELMALATELLASDRRVMHFTNAIDQAVFASMTSSAEDPADVARRSLVNIANKMTQPIYLHRVPEKLVTTLKRVCREGGWDFDNDRLEKVADLIGHNVPTMKFPMNVMVGIILDRWHQRPVALDIGGPMQSGEPGNAWK